LCQLSRMHGAVRHRLTLRGARDHDIRRRHVLAPGLVGQTIEQAAQATLDASSGCRRQDQVRDLWTSPVGSEAGWRAWILPAGTVCTSARLRLWSDASPADMGRRLGQPERSGLRGIDVSEYRGVSSWSAGPPWSSGGSPEACGLPVRLRRTHWVRRGEPLGVEGGRAVDRGQVQRSGPVLKKLAPSSDRVLAHHRDRPQ
jgi:hypothetical protein